MHKYLKAAIILALLSGCGDNPKPDRAAKKQARIEAARVVVSRTPQPKTYRIDGNEIKIVEVPTVDSAGYVDMQRCFVWRDAEFRTSAMSCPNDPDVPFPSGGATSDQH